jgi:hypothetical protein
VLAIESTAFVLIVIAAGYLLHGIRWPQCGLHLGRHAVAHRAAGRWLHWLTTAERCPRCGADHAGAIPASGEDATI